MTTPSKEPPAAPGEAFPPQLAHELRNRLAPMRNAAYLLRKRLGDDEQGQWALAVIERQIDQLNETIAALADLTKISRGVARIDNIAFDLSIAIATAAQASAAALAARQQTLDRRAAPAPLTIMGDPERVTQSLRVSIEAVGKRAAAGAHLELHCASREGAIEIAIAPAQPAEQATGSTGGTDSGTNDLGVQFALAQWVIELHGGALGATFDAAGALHVRIRLPLPAIPS